MKKYHHPTSTSRHGNHGVFTSADPSVFTDLGGIAIGGINPIGIRQSVFGGQLGAAQAIQNWIKLGQIEQYRGPSFTLPVGISPGGTGTFVRPLPQLPALLPDIEPITKTTSLPRPPVRGNTTPNRKVVFNREGEPTVTVSPPVSIPRPPVISSPSPTGGGLPTNIPIKGPVMDLGTILGDLGGQYIQTRFGQQPTQQILQPAFFGGGDSSGGMPGLDVISEAPVRGMVWNPAANCGAGKWQKRTRRRRRRLATQGDLKDLAALKGVLGGGKAFEVWIATHGG